MALAKSRYTTRFVASAARYVPPVDQMETLASLDKMRALLPRDIKPDDHPTLLYVVGNLAVGGLCNLNDDGITLDDTLATYRGFEWQQANIEHERANVRGVIVKAGLSEFGTDRLLTEEEARAAGKPVNIAIIIALWKVVDPDLCAFLEAADAPASPDRDRLSLSFEVGFDDYDIVVLPKGVTNLAMASKIMTPSLSNSREFDRYDRLLRVNGGKGVIGTERVARIIKGHIIPLGAGIVTVPAAAVKGLTTITVDPYQGESDAGLYKYSSTQCTLNAADAAPILDYVNALPDDTIYTDPDDTTLGREQEPHVTACYGITGTDPAPVRLCLQGCAPVKVTLGEISAFVNEDKPYDVLKIDVESEDLHNLHQLIKSSVEVESKWPNYHPHLTLGYLKKGAAATYVGDSRFKGRGLTFPSISFSPHTGDRVEIPLGMTDGTVAQTEVAAVYSEEDDDLIMATPSRFIKLSAGWQERLAALQSAAGKDPLVNGVNVVLSDGRTLSNLKIFDGQTLELDKELSMSGVVVTDMTPGAPPQADSQVNEHPFKADVYPTRDPAAQARNDERVVKKHEGQNEAYTDASAAVIEKLAENDKKFTESVRSITQALEIFVRATEVTTAATNLVLTGVSSSTTSPSLPMNLESLKQSLAAVKTVDELPTVVANVALFAEEISKASEKLVAERKSAQETAQAAQITADEVKAQLVALQKSHNELVAAQEAAAAETKFNERMASVEEVFALEDDVRADVVEEVKACADDASFTKWMTSAKKKMKGWLKDKKGDKGKNDKEPDADDTKAKLDAQAALASAKNNIVDTPISNNLDVTDKTLRQQYEEVFARNTNIGNLKISDIRGKNAKK